MQACKEHDLCLEDPAYEVAGVSSDEACLASKFMGLPNCYCDSELAHKAWEVSGHTRAVVGGWFVAACRAGRMWSTDVWGGGAVGRAVQARV